MSGAGQSTQELESKLVDLIGKLEDAGSELGPQVIEAGLFAVRGIAVAEIGLGLVALVASFFLLRFAYGNVIKVLENTGGGAEELCFFSGVAATVLGIISLIGGAKHVFHASAWLAVVSPEAALVYRLLLA